MIGGLGTIFGNLITASSEETSYSIAKATGYSNDSYYNLKAMDASLPGFNSQIDRTQVMTTHLVDGNEIGFTLDYDKAKSTSDLDSIEYSADDKTFHKILTNGVKVEDFRINMSMENNAEDVEVAIRQILITGHYVPEN
jgi:hypothetical protein